MGEEGVGKQREVVSCSARISSDEGCWQAERGGGQKTHSACISSNWGVGRQREVVTSSPALLASRTRLEQWRVLAGRANLPKWGRGFSVVMGIS